MMGYAYYLINGRERGYAVEALCDEEICERKIDHGLAYLCGDDPYGGPDSCAGYFCGEHLYFTDRGQRCDKCARAMECEGCGGHGIVRNALSDGYDDWIECDRCDGTGNKTLEQMLDE
jgi:hypothetical protein